MAPLHSGDNPRAVQTLLGHSSIATTERYLAVDDLECRAACCRLFERYGPQGSRLAQRQSGLATAFVASSGGEAVAGGRVDAAGQGFVILHWGIRGLRC